VLYIALHLQYYIPLINIPLAVMVSRKTTTLNLRVDPAIKEAIREAAHRDQRSIANMIEVLIRRYCADVGITIPEQGVLFQDEDNG
jgi:hypothetical protein